MDPSKQEHSMRQHVLIVLLRLSIYFHRDNIPETLEGILTKR